MYRKLSCKLSFGNRYALKGVQEIEVKKSIHTIVQTATVKLPLSVVFRNNEQLQRIRLSDKIKEGDTVTLNFGYENETREEFTGYIRRIDYAQPLVLYLEDELYPLRFVRIKKAFGKCTLAQLITFLLDEIKVKKGLLFHPYEHQPELSFSNFIMNNVSVLDVLSELKDKYGLRCYLTTISGRKTLYCGLAYGLEKGAVKYELGRNTVDVDELKYNVSEEERFKVKIKNYRKDGTTIEYVFGEERGQEIEMQPEYGDFDKTHFESLATMELQRLKSQGFRGNFKTLLIPNCEPGTIAYINDPQFPERKGKYFIASIVTTFGDGGTRKPEIGVKLYS